MLSQYYRTEVDNQSGATITQVNIWRNANKVTSYENARTQIHNQASQGTGTQSQGTAQDNSSDLWISADLEIEIVMGGSPSGPVTIRVQRSLDGVNWPDNQKGDEIEVLEFTVAETQKSVVGYS